MHGVDERNYEDIKSDLVNWSIEFCTCPVYVWLCISTRIGIFYQIHQVSTFLLVLSAVHGTVQNYLDMFA